MATATKKTLSELEDADYRVYLIGQEMREKGLYDLYAEVVASGESPSMAAIVVTQKAPASANTDTDFARREHDRMASYSDRTREHIVKIARDNGISTAGKTYNGQLGKYNDPHAWVSDTSDVRKAAKAKGLALRGMVNCDYVNPELVAKKKTPMAEDLQAEFEQRYRANDPVLNEKCRRSEKARRELRERIVEKHARKRKK